MKSHRSLPVVRQPGRGGREVLYVDLQELEDRRRSPATARRARRSTAGKPGTVMTVEFELDGQQVHSRSTAARMFKFNEAISFQVTCETQAGGGLLLGEALGGRRREGAAVRLAQGQVRRVLAGRARRSLPAMLSDQDPTKAERVMKAMLQMKKLDIAALQRAHSG